MRTRLWGALAMAGALLFLAGGARAQTQTNVTATVTDTLGIPYANGTYSIQLIPTGNNPTVNGQSIGGAFNGSTDANGSFNVSLWPNASISPAGTHWQFTVCVSPGVQPPLGTGGQCSTPPAVVTVAGATQSLSATLSAVAPRLTTITIGGGTVTGTGASPQVAFWSSPTALSGDAQFQWDSTNHFATMGVQDSALVPAIQNWASTDSNHIAYLGDRIPLVVLSQWTGTQTPIETVNFVSYLNSSMTPQSGNAHAAGESDEVCVPPIGGIATCGGLLGHATNIGSAGTVAEMVGVKGFVNTPIGNTTTTQIGFKALSNANGANGTIANNYGFFSAAQGGIGGTLNAAFFAQDQTAGATNFSFYSAGGQNRFLAGVSQTLPILDIDATSTATPFGGENIVRGTGLGLDNNFTEPILRETIQENQLAIAHATWSKAAPGFELLEMMLNNGDYERVLSAPTVAPIFYMRASGSIDISPDSVSTGVRIGNIFGPTVFTVTPLGAATALAYNTVTNCSGVGTAANPSVAACTAAIAGSFSCATNASTGTCRVTTTAVTANSQIFVQEDDSLGTKLGVTCNVNNVLPATAPLLGARSAGASFTINLGTFTTNPLCFSYFIVN